MNNKEFVDAVINLDDTFNDDKVAEILETFADALDDDKSGVLMGSLKLENECLIDKIYDRFKILHRPMIYMCIEFSEVYKVGRWDTSI